MTQTTYKTHSDGSIDFEHYMREGRQARSEAAHKLFGGFANALRSMYLISRSRLLRVTAWNQASQIEDSFDYYGTNSCLAQKPAPESSSTSSGFTIRQGQGSKKPTVMNK